MHRKTEATFEHEQKLFTRRADFKRGADVTARACLIKVCAGAMQRDGD